MDPNTVTPEEAAWFVAHGVTPPEGSVWREVEPFECGELHLIAPDGYDLSLRASSGYTDLN